MGSIKEFERKLDKLFKERTYWIRRAVGKSIYGQRPIFDRKKRSDTINELQLLIEDSLRGKAKEEFRKGCDKVGWHRIKGWGSREKKDNLGKWIDKKGISKKYIYIFWSGKNCLYVGRCGTGGKRAADH